MAVGLGKLETLIFGLTQIPVRSQLTFQLNSRPNVPIPVLILQIQGHSNWYRNIGTAAQLKSQFVFNRLFS